VWRWGQDSGELPEWLLPDGEMDRALAQVGGEKNALVSRQVDKQHGITQLRCGPRPSALFLAIVPDCVPRLIDSKRRLANGVRVSLKQTKFDAKEAYISVFAVGGRCGEGHVEGIKTGAVVLGMQSALQSGLGPYGPNVVNRYCQLHEIDFDGGSSSEKLALEISASTSEADAMRRAFEVAHLFLRAPSIDDAALERVKRDSVVRHEANQRSLEALTSITLLKMLAHPSARAEPDPRMTVITPEVIDKLDREDLLSALRAELTPENLEVPGPSSILALRRSAARAGTAADSAGLGRWLSSETSKTPLLSRHWQCSTLHHSRESRAPGTTTRCCSALPGVLVLRVASSDSPAAAAVR
jgi:hypothetical protein